MNTKTPILLAVVAFSTFSTGCVGTGPNTQRGAVGGAALGALAGAMLGNNSGNGNAASGALIGAAAGAMVGGTLGNAEDHERGTLYYSEREATTGIVMAEPPAPPPRREEVVIMTQPAPGAVWVDGYWAYTGRGRYAWVEGRWLMPPPHCRAYVAPHWKRHRGGYIYVQGYWRG